MILKTPNNPAPWWVDGGDEVIFIRDREGFAVCAMPRKDDVNERDEQDALAELIAMAPELFAQLHALTAMIRRCDAELIRVPEDFPNDYEYDAELDNAQALLDLLAESGCVLGERA